MDLSINKMVKEAQEDVHLITKDDVGKKTMAVLYGGKIYIGILRSVDYFHNLVLSHAIQRFFTKNLYGDIYAGIVMIRGDSLCICAEFDEGQDAEISRRLQYVSSDEIKVALAEEEYEKEEKRLKLKHRGFDPEETEDC